MSEILAVVERASRASAMLEVAGAYARVLGCDVVVYATDAALEAARRAAGPDQTVRPLPRATPEWVAGRASRPRVRLVVVSSEGMEDGWCADLLQSCPAPVLVVPASMSGVEVELPAARILVPLDGTPESTAAVAEIIELFAATGADVVVLHVFDIETTPAFWDQPVHARRSWGEEFLARHAHGPGIRLELRSGAPGQAVLDVAASESTDLIALGWSRKFSPGRAKTVRNTIGHAAVPVLLVPLTPLATPGNGRESV